MATSRLRGRVVEVIRLAAGYKKTAAAAATLAAYAAIKSACVETVPTTDARLRRMPPPFLDRLRASNVATSIPESQTGETTLHGRVQLIAPPEMRQDLTANLGKIFNRLIIATEEYAAAIGYEDHLKGHTWNLVVRKERGADASTLDGTVFLSSGMLGKLIVESKAWQAGIAGVLAHELGHNLARHVLENQLVDLHFRWIALWSLPLRYFKEVVAARGLPSRGWVARWHDEEVLSLSRQREHEADELAVSILAQAGYPPDSLATILPLIDGDPSPPAPSALQRAQRRREEGPNTHPPCEERVARMLQMAGRPEVQQAYRTHSWWTRLWLRWL